MVAHGVAVHACDACLGKHFLQPLFSLLRSHAKKIEMLALAFRAEFRNGSAKSAVMAFHALMDGRRQIVFGRRTCDGSAQWRSSRIPAFHRRHGTSPQRSSRAGSAAAWPALRVPASPQFPPPSRARADASWPVSVNSRRMSIKETCRQRTVGLRVLQREQRVFSALCIRPGLQRRRRRAQDNGCTAQFGAHHSDIACMIARQLRLLVRGIMFFIDDDQGQMSRSAQRLPSACRRQHSPRHDGSDATGQCAPHRSVRNAATPPDCRSWNRNCATMAGVKPISGTSSRLESPASSARRMAAI